MIGAIALAQGGIGGVFRPQPADSDTVAVVNGQPLLRGPIRQAVDFALLKDPRADRNQLTRDALVALIRSTAAVTEARKRGIDAGNQALIDLEAAKEMCREQSSGQPCREFIEAQGLPWDTFWQEQLPRYENAVLVRELTAQVAKERGVDVSTYEKWHLLEEIYLRELASQASIQWIDQGLKKLYGSG